MKIKVQKKVNLHRKYEKIVIEKFMMNKMKI